MAKAAAETRTAKLARWKKQPPWWWKLGVVAAVPALLLVNAALPYIALALVTWWAYPLLTLVLVPLALWWRRHRFARDLAGKIGQVAKTEWFKVKLTWRRPQPEHPSHPRLRKALSLPEPVAGDLVYPRATHDQNPKLQVVVADILAGAMDFEVDIDWKTASRRVHKHAPFKVVRWPDSGAWPLLGAERTDMWAPCPIGRDRQHNPTDIALAYRNALVGGEPGAGKALALDTPVPTPTGWTTQGDLQAGDEVFDEDGNICQVTHAWPVQHDRPCFQVCFSDGSVIVADAEHEWLTDTRASRLSAWRATQPPNRASAYSNDQRHKRARPGIVTTAQIRDTLRTQAAGRLNHSVRLAGALHLPTAPLPLPPYTLGVWLAVGNQRNGQVTLNRLDAGDIESGMTAEGVAHHRLQSWEAPGSVVTALDGWARKLADAGLHRNKHIPPAYLRASDAQRRALLAGLLDGDGHVTPSGTVEFSASDQRLANQVHELVCSVGYKPTLRRKTARLNGRDMGPTWTVAFTPPDKVLSVTRKASRQKLDVRATHDHRFITDVRPMASVPVRCVTVSSASHLYLAGKTMIPTHNSVLLALFVAYAALDPMVTMDLFDGTEVDMAPWAPCARNMVGNDVEHAIGVLRSIQEEMDRRKEFLLDRNGVVRKIDRDCPFGFHLVVCDEMAFYFNVEDPLARKTFATLMTDIVARGRKFGVILIGATQKPSGDNIPTKLRDLIAYRIAMRCTTTDASDTVLGKGHASDGFDATKIRMDRPGVGWLLAEQEKPRQIRSYWLSDPQIEQLAERAALLRAANPPMAWLTQGSHAVPLPQPPAAGEIAPPRPAPLPPTVTTVYVPTLGGEDPEETPGAAPAQQGGPDEEEAA